MERSFVYDQVMADKELRSGPGEGVIRHKNLDSHFDDSLMQHGYVQKSKYEGVWNKHVKPREDFKDVAFVPMTSAQVVGWRKPIDNMRDLGHPNVNRKAVCDRSFHDGGHL